jgi:D-alanyl-D-alanine carboxypeptidase/D-alanyl-D-alanine-endopeptidase (penicillin-binding protein 4)
MRSPYFSTWKQSLPVVGVDGSLVDVATSSPAKDKIFAKTGTLADGDDLNSRLLVGSKALAGYLQEPDGHLNVFSLAVNQATAQRVQDVLAINDDVGLMAAQFWQAER